MPTLEIDGQKVEVEDGLTVIQAAERVGIEIPHYCWHPGLSISGNCRMCLVEIEKAPKLQIACNTRVTEGMVVRTTSEKTQTAQKAVLEFLLLNHPIDCPVCDQAGECELQDYTFQEGRGEGRYREPKRFNPVEDFGGDVVYVANRCILCTRCVRFMDDVAHDPVLNVSERGDRALIGKFEGQDMTHPWAGNVIDLCPVGALLSKDSLNKARAWELDRTLEIAMDALRLPPGDTRVETLSGGERRRVALCRLLLQKPDLLLLDEPTNHLDAESVAWLERHLQEYPGTVVAITHDRYFLDNVAEWILELDRGRGIPWKGNYTE